MDRDSQIEGLQTAAAGIPVGKLLPDLIEDIVVGCDGLTNHQWFCRLQRLPDALAAGDFTDTGMPGIILQNHDIAGKKRAMCPAEVKQHAVKTGDRNHSHFGDFGCAA